MKIDRRSFGFLLAAGALLGRVNVAKSAAPAPTAPTPASSPPVLPKDIVWETNNDDPIIGSEKAIRGGILNLSTFDYPLTFRVMGPDSNDYFAQWNWAFTTAFTLISMHPVTDNFIPLMATHWSVQKDQKTIYFKLDPDARWSDGNKITADDYVFTWKMMQSKFIVDPVMNIMAKQYYELVEKIDDYTLKIVGTHASWRPLYDFATLWPTPAHTIVLDKDWVTRTNNQPQIAPGPYIVSGTVRGESVTFKRVPNWWGDKKRYFVGQYNFDEIHLRVIAQERELDYVRLGQFDMMEERSPKNWHEGYDFPAVTNGWLKKARVFVDWPDGVSGLQMDLTDPIFQNRDFRIALQYLYDFDRLNRNLWYSEYFPLNSFFQGTAFANPEVKAYPFDPAKAREHLERAGYRRPKTMGDQSLLGRLRNTVYGLVFTRTDADDIRVNDHGERAAFTLIYNDKLQESALTVIQQDYRRAGVDMRLQLLEPGTLGQRVSERKFEMAFIRFTSGLYPEPRQYLGSEFKSAANNNDMWGFGTKEVDGLIDTYEKSLDADARKAAMYKIDQIVHDEAFYIPYRSAPYVRLVYWDYLQFPDFYLPKRTQQITDWMVYWIDPAKKAKLAEDVRAGRAYPVDQDLDKDFYGVRKKFQ